jgi:hypothetical protein
MNDQVKQEDTVSFGDKRVEINTVERYKGRRNVTDRLGIISGGLLRAYTYFYEGQGGKKTVFRVRPKAEGGRPATNPETLRYVEGILGAPTQRFGMLLFHYQTDDKGELIEPEKLKGKIKTWVVSETRYAELDDLNRQYPLLCDGLDGKQHDFLAKCTEDKYQKITFLPLPTAHWKSNQKWFDALKARELKAKEKLRMALGYELKDHEILALLGGGAVATEGDIAGDIDLSDIIGDE